MGIVAIHDVGSYNYTIENIVLIQLLVMPLNL